MEARGRNFRDEIETNLRNSVADSHAWMVHFPIIFMLRRDNLANRRAATLFTPRDL